MKTRAAYMKSPWQFEIREVELSDTPPAGWIRLRVDACGICGTDLTAAAENTADWAAFGHEIAGVVEAVGPEVGTLEPGQSVALESGSACGRCDLCRDGRNDLCVGRVPGFWGQAAMGFSDTMLAPACCAVPYDGLPPAVACLAEPAGVGFDMVRVADIRMGQRVCVVGPGLIALVALALAIRRGASEALCIGHSHSKARLELAKGLGADVLAVDGPLDERDDLRRRFDHVLMAAPTQFIVPALALLDYGGTMTYIGIGTGDGTIRFDANDFHYRKLQLRASFASPALYFPAVLRLLKAGAIPGEELISHTFKLAEIERAMLTCRDDKATALKVVVTP
ncbi:MAG: alcohol dehydrogenase catalytic domain-containing protein [Candidatus Hydrogenedentes bacterium]|nr:alcohol dehydrogenase catalytic domain-containing protein [Candidatus Hydrogenedentota bacterium]